MHSVVMLSNGSQKFQLAKKFILKICKEILKLKNCWERKSANLNNVVVVLKKLRASTCTGTETYFVRRGRKGALQILRGSTLDGQINIATNYFTSSHLDHF